MQFSVTSRRLAEDVRELIVSLGYRCSLSKRVKGRTPASSTAYTITFSTTDEVFRLERKRLIHKERRGPGRTGKRLITAVRPVPSVPVRCVEVDSSDHLYLASRSMVPTHNSTLGLDFARHAAVKAAVPTVVFSLEMSKTELVQAADVRRVHGRHAAAADGADGGLGLVAADPVARQAGRGAAVHRRLAAIRP